MTPALRVAESSDNSLLSAPRSLNEAVNCRFSNLRWISQPAIAESVSDWRVGVRCTDWPMAAAALRISASVTSLGALLVTRTAISAVPLGLVAAEGFEPPTKG